MQETTQPRKSSSRIVAIAAAALFSGTVLASAPANAAPAAHQQVAHKATAATQQVAAKRTAQQAINWYKSRKGSTAYEGYCEKAARLSWARTTHHPSAIQHWNSSDGARHKNKKAPKGAFVFWNISSYGHVGISDGSGGAWATDVNGHIGHIASLSHFSNYLGWKPGNSN